MIAQAIKLAAEVHEHQVDKGGEPYILHCLAVMQGVHAEDLRNPLDRPVLLCAAVLHDVIEDFEGEPGERSQLRDFIYQTFGDRCYAVIDTLTKYKDDDYGDYIERVAKNWMARRIKIADLTHNMDTGRLPEGDIGEKDFERWDKYRRSLVRLKRED